MDLFSLSSLFSKILMLKFFQVTFINSDGTENLHPSPPFKIRLSKKLRESSHALPGNVNSSLSVKSNDNMADGESQKEKLIVETYIPADPGPYPQDKPKQNSVRFTPTQVPITFWDNPLIPIGASLVTNVEVLRHIKAFLVRVKGASVLRFYANQHFKTVLNPSSNFEMILSLIKSQFFLSKHT